MIAGGCVTRAERAIGRYLGLKLTTYVAAKYGPAHSLFMNLTLMTAQ